MATKRRLQVKEPQEDEEEELDERHLPVIKRPDWGWRDWLLRDYLRYWYVAGCLFLDVLVVLEINKDVDPGLSISIPVIVLIGMIMLEVLVFRSLWGKDGRWQKR
jgi:hypothetical protein